MSTTMIPTELDDRRLVELHLGGHGGAFRQIVERYQSLVCALTLSACGDLARSEDLAQEVFVAAWQKLPQLREPEKLRSWLCGIARNLAHNALRRDRRTPTAGADELLPDTAPAVEADPRDRAIGADEATLMWRALAELPEAYREPMVLFYREHQSSQAVAESLEISEGLVRQRLARGRAMLTERMAKLVEETLERSAPTSAFSAAVLMALPMGVGPTLVMTEAGAATGGAASKALATAGAVGSAFAKGSLAIKVLASIAALPALLNGLMDYLRFRAQMQSPDEAHRREAIQTHMLPVLVSAMFILACAVFFWTPLPEVVQWLLALPIVGSGLWLAFRSDCRRRRLAAEARGVESVFEYRSRQNFLGLPLIHVRAGGPKRQRSARGWIAVSDGYAVGGLFASAPFAVAPISMGAVSLGVLSVGAVAVGLAALGVAAGGDLAMGGFAAAIHAAKGAMAFAQEMAVGKIVVATHANDAIATAFVTDHIFFRLAEGAWRIAVWAAFFGWAPPLALMSWDLARAKTKKA